MRCSLLPALAVSLALLAACDGQPPTRATRASASPPLTTTAPRPSLPPGTRPAPGALTAPGDVPALHAPYEDVRNVAPDLQLIVSAVPVPAAQAVQDPSDLKLVLTIKRHRQVIFRDTVDDGLTYTEFSEPATERLYPIWLPTGPGAGELLVAYNNRPSRDRVRRFIIRGDQVVHLDTLPTFDEPARDLDHDGRLEYHGLPDYGEEWTDEQGRHRSVYNPTLYYEVRPGGLVLDSALTIRTAQVKYGKFYGFTYSEKPFIVLK